MDPSVTSHKVTAPGGRAVLVDSIAPDELIESKRAPTIITAEHDLENEIQVLEEGTRVKNRELEKQLSQIEERSRQWEAAMTIEVAARDTAHEDLVNTFRENFSKECDEFEGKINNTFSHVRNDLLPPPNQRVTDLEQKFEDFIFQEVPAVIESLQGSVTRKLQKSYETFHIDNTKLRKRERKIVQHFETLQVHSHQLVSTETQSRQDKYLSLHEEFNERMAREDREVCQSQVRMLKDLKDVSDKLTETSQERETADLHLLDRMAEAMERLQQSILMNFGVEQANALGEQQQEQQQSSLMQGQVDASPSNSMQTKMVPDKGDETNVGENGVTPGGLPESTGPEGSPRGSDQQEPTKVEEQPEGSDRTANAGEQGEP